MGAPTGHSADQGRRNQREGNFTSPSDCCATDIPSRPHSKTFGRRVYRMRLQKQSTGAVPLCLELGHANSSCPSSLSTTDNADNVWPCPTLLMMTGRPCVPPLACRVVLSSTRASQRTTMHGCIDETTGGSLWSAAVSEVSSAVVA